MKSLFLFLIITFLTITAFSADEKLQIHITRRAENCVRISKKGDQLLTFYTGLLLDGTAFDLNMQHTFTLGKGKVIDGWEMGLLNMCVGEQRILIIPPHLGYGERGALPVIPANATLIFDVELLKIN